LLGLAITNAASNQLMTREAHSTLEASGTEWPELRDHIPCMGDVIQLPVGEFMSRLDDKCHTKSSEPHNHYQQCEENDSIYDWMSHRLRKEANARINNVSAMRPG
jgi:hypothetical protein